jgi:diguanylate cyclase (GGDEF)-like protein
LSQTDSRDVIDLVQLGRPVAEPYAPLPGARELRRRGTERVLFGTGYLLASFACLALLPAGHRFSAMALVAAGLFLAASSHRLWLSNGWVGFQQAAFVLLVFTLPLPLVPLATLALTALTMRVELSPAGVLAAAGNCWSSVAAVVTLALLAPGPAGWSHWPAYVAAFCAQRVADDLVFSLRCLVRRRALIPTDHLTSVAVDMALTPIGLAAAVQIRYSAGGALALMVGATALVVIAGREHHNMRTEADRALRDPLTGLANRALFHEAGAACMARCRRNGQRGALVMIDLDDFKLINDSWGHHAGDDVLREFAVRLRESTREVDVAARLGGDEFAVIVAESVDARAAERLARTLRHSLTCAAIIADGHTVHVECSLGLALFGAEVSLEEAFTQADRELYAEKRARKQAASVKRPTRERRATRDTGAPALPAVSGH